MDLRHREKYVIIERAVILDRRANLDINDRSRVATIEHEATASTSIVTLNRKFVANN